MGCGSSKTLIKSASVIEEFLIPLQKKGSDCEQILGSKNKTDHQIITVLCTSNTLAKHLKEQESSKQSSPIINNASDVKNSPISNDASQSESLNLTTQVMEDLEESATKIETISTWELLNGLEEDEEVEKLGERNCSMSLNPISNHSEGSRCEGINQEDCADNGLRRKATATEIAALKVPAFEFSRTVSLRDWLMQGGPVMSDGSYVSPKFGNFEHQGDGSKARSRENSFDADLVAQIEQAMEDLTLEEEKLLEHIVVKWENNVRKSFEGWN